eukprot:2282514-Pyramimonas_sp.AAC.1
MLPVLRSVVGQHQFACILGRGTPTAILSARILQRPSSAKQLCIAFLFVDVINAFYSCVRELVLATDTSEASLLALLRTTGLPAGYLPRLQERLQQIPLLHGHDLPEHYVAMVQEAFRML